jgi:type II secretory pathway component PulK
MSVTNFKEISPGSDKGRSTVFNDRGSALIITLLLISILVGLVVNFVYEVYIDSSAVSNWSNAQRASYIAKSGQNIAASFIKQINLYPHSNIREIALPVVRDFGQGATLVVTVEDENSKFNINIIANPDNIPRLQKLFEYLKINPDIALIIADWIDPDSDPRTSDSEDVAKNGLLWSIDELKLIKAIDNEVFDKISPYVTATTNWLNWKININTAELPVLVSLDKNMTESLAERIIDFRKDSPFETVDQVQNISGLKTIGINIIGKSDVRSKNFRVMTRATVNDIPRIIETVIDTNSKIYFWRET